METHTCDMQLAGYLIATGHPLVRIDEARRRKVFVFEHCEDATQDFYKGTGTVNARALFDGYFLFKTAVFGDRA